MTQDRPTGTPSNGGDEEPRTDRTPRWRPGIVFREKPPLHGAVESPRPLCPEEERLARSLAEELDYAAAVVARDPARRHPGNSVAGAVRRLVERSGKDPETLSRQGEELLSRSGAERQRTFGSFARAGSRSRLSRAVMNDERRALVREIARKRVEAYRAELHATHEFALAGGMNLYEVCKTELEGITSHELNEYYTERGISSPVVLDLRWTTECDEAEIGVWELRRFPSRTVVGKGTVPLNSDFSVDLQYLLPAEPPADPQHYDLRIRPHLAPKIEKVGGATPGSSQVVKIPPEPVSGYSNPVLLTYQKDMSKPQKFAENIIYRNAVLHIDHLHMVEQQSGSGSDEYWLYATLMASAGEEEAVARDLLKWKAVLDGAHDTSVIDFARSFHLENPASARWPKTFALLLTVMEEDGGEEIADTMAEIWTAVSGWLLGEFFDEVKDFLGEVGLDDWSTGTIAAGLAGLAAALAGSIAGAIAGMVLVFVNAIISIVTHATQDDFYETKSVVFALPTNTTDYVHQAADGSVMADGSFRFAAEHPEFRYTAIDYEDAPPPWQGLPPVYDGLVEVQVHWELENPEDLFG